MSEEKEPKTLTNSRWQDGNNTPRYDRNQQKDVDAVLDGTRGYARGARINNKGN